MKSDDLIAEHKTLRREIDIDRLPTCYRGRFFAMGSPCETLVETDDASLAQQVASTVADEAWRIESKFSRYRDDNIIYRIHHSGGEAIEVDEELASLLNFAQQCFELSDGLFDITSGVLRRIWKFDGSDNIPTRQQSDQLLDCIGWDKVDWHPPYLTLPAGMEIDLGGIGKEYAVDRAGQLARQLTDQPVLINFGGDLYATRPPLAKDSWQIGIESVDYADHSAMITIIRGGVATSGDAKRYLESGGIRYPHVLDPRTGRSVMAAPRSITVAAETCIEAGFLSTLAMLKGTDARSFLQAQDVVFWIQE